MTTTAARAAALPPLPDLAIGEWTLEELTPLAEHHVMHDGSSPTLADITGYIVRRTIVAGVTVPDGVDVAVYGPPAYAAATDLAWKYRTRPARAGDPSDTTPWGWAVVDTVYACGCRS